MSLTQRTDAQSTKRAAVEAAVLRATEELLEEGASYADLGIEKIASRAGISRTAFYFYFRDKRELLMRLTEEVSERLYAEADRWWSGPGEARDELHAAIGSIVGLYREHASLLRAVVEVSTYDAPVGDAWRALVGRFVEATRARIEAAAPDLPAAPVAFALVWMAERSCYEHIVVNRDPDADLVTALVTVWDRTIYGT